MENPSGNDEYRYIRLAWKADGGTGVMIQFPDNGGWGAVTDPCVGRYDSIYLAWTEDELQQLLTGIFPVEPLSKLTTTWGDVKTLMLMDGAQPKRRW